MSEPGRAVVVEGEAPVNPYSLLEAVNNSSDTVHTGWLIFIGIMSYLLIAVAGVTHKDLLLSSDIQLPVLQVKIDLTRFFLFAPMALVLFHLGVVAQLVMLARKTLEFDNAIRILEATDRRTHPLRLELHNFFFVQAIAGPERSRIMSTFLHGMTWLTLVVLPVILLLYVQVVFLPYHDVVITWAHRVALSADIALLLLIGVFLTRSEERFFVAFWRNTRAHPFTSAMTLVILVVVSAFSFLVATVPGERLDMIGRLLGGSPVRAGTFGTDRAAYGFALPFLEPRADGSLFGLFERNLNVTDLDLVVDKDVTAGEPSLNLRNRDLRFARLDRTDLHQADLTGADLEGASLVGADLRGVLLQCADLSDFILNENRAAARCPNARRANFSRARMKEARLSGADLRGARLEDADLEGAELAYAAMTGATFYNAQLQRADLTSGLLQAANFGSAALQGADLTGAKLYGADFSSAGLQGVVLAHAYLQGATLRDADLEGADLYKAQLQGADLRGAKVRAATLREATLWLTGAPEREPALLVDLTDLSSVAVRPIEPGEVETLNQMLLRIEDVRTRARVKDALAPLLLPQARTAWATGNPDLVAWQALILTSTAGLGEAYKQRLTSHLADMACKPRWANGGVATGVARRAQSYGFRGDIEAVYGRLKDKACPAADTVSRRVLRTLATAVDVAKGQ